MSGETIPEDIMKTAAAVWATLPLEGAGIYAIAKALLGERQSHFAVRRTNCADAAAIRKIINEGSGFADTNPEARFISDAELSCPHCGGSGHKDDVRDQWRDISTAPKEELAFFLVFAPETDEFYANIGSVYRLDGRLLVVGNTSGQTPEEAIGEITHWMPLPSPPTPTKAREEA